MLKRDQLEKLKTVTGFDTWQTEKDYIQHLFLLFLSRRVKNELDFKGGTALQKAYGLNRFSVDLDFTLNGTLDITSVLDGIAADFSGFGYKTTAKCQFKNTAITALLKVQGPLYDGTDKTFASIRIEISSREKILMQPVWKEIVPVYEDIQPYIVYVMPLEEILAEKVRAVLTRAKARDVYDLWFLLRKGVQAHEDLISQKLEYYDIEFDYAKFSQAVEKGPAWEKELRPLITAVPAFNEAKKFILEEAKKWNFQKKSR